MASILISTQTYGAFMSTMLSTVFTNTFASALSRLPVPNIWAAGTTQQRTLILGVALAVLSNVLFGVLYAYSSFLAPLSGTQVFVWRMLAMWAALIGYLVISGRLGLHMTQLKKIRGIKQWAWLLLPTPIFLSQFWLFMWAPVNGQGVQTAMGYFLFPLMMVVFGCILLVKSSAAYSGWLLALRHWASAVRLYAHKVCHGRRCGFVGRILSIIFYVVCRVLGR